MQMNNLGTGQLIPTRKISCAVVNGTLQIFISFIKVSHASPSVLLTLLVGRQKGIQPVKNGGMMEVGTGWFGWSDAQLDG